MGKLIDYAEVKSGHPFRGTVPEDKNGLALTIQMRDVDEHDGVSWHTLARTSPAGRKDPDWLRAGDVLFLSRGAHNFAVYLDQVPEKTICSQYFFVIRVHDVRILPAFLAWQINQGPAQVYLRKNAEGSDQLSIRRAILEALPLVLPSLAQQRQLLRLTQTALQEKRHMELMIRNRDQQIAGIVAQILASVPS
jgi:hypothetical protein